jgi:Ca2+-binding EF-hand superfamily protein
MPIDWTTLNAKLPTEKFSDQSNEFTEQRREIFTQYFDVNRNGYCSLAECDKGLTELLLTSSNVDNDNNDMSIILAKPVILRAFTSAKSIAQEKGRSESSSRSDYIEFSEFRYFLLYIKEYIQLWELFAAMDSDNDRRISYDEFVSDTLPKLHNNEYYSRIFPASATNESIFQSIDNNHGGYILFIELAQYVIKKKIMLAQE